MAKANTESEYRKARRLAQENKMTLPTALSEAEKQANDMILGNTEQAPAEQNATNNQPNEIPKKSASEDVDWQARYQVLQGKYNAEIPTLQAKVKQLEQSPAIENKPVNSNLQTENERLRQQIAELKQAKPVELTLDENLVNDYGEDFARSVASVARQQSTAEIEALRNEFNSKISSAQEDINAWTTDSKMQAVKSTLASQKINFEQIDNDPLFHQWLSEQDGYSGQTRHALMMDAFNTADLHRVARFYAAYNDSIKTRTVNNPLNEHIQQSPSQSPDIGGTQPRFDLSQFQELHRKYQQGRLSDDEFQKAEREMYAAMGG